MAEDSRIVLMDHGFSEDVVDAPSDVRHFAPNTTPSARPTHLILGPTDHRCRMSVWWCAPADWAVSAAIQSSRDIRDNGGGSYVGVEKAIVAGGYEKDEVLDRLVRALEMIGFAGSLSIPFLDVSRLDAVGGITEFAMHSFASRWRDFDVTLKNGEPWTFILTSISEHSIVYYETVAGGPRSAFVPWRDTVIHMINSIRPKVAKSSPTPGVNEESVALSIKKVLAARGGTPTPSPTGSSVAQVQPPSPPPVFAQPERSLQAPPKRPLAKCDVCRHYMPANPAIPPVATRGAFEKMQTLIDDEAKLREQMRTMRQERYDSPPRYAAFCRHSLAVFSEPSIKNWNGLCADYAPRRMTGVKCEYCRFYCKGAGPKEEEELREKLMEGDYISRSTSSPTKALSDMYERHRNAKETEGNELSDQGFFGKKPKWYDSCSAFGDIGNYVDNVKYNMGDLCQSYEER